MGKLKLDRPMAEFSLPSNRSFVVHIEAHSELTQQRLTGRIEHLVTGRATRFQSIQDVMAFIRWSLNRNDLDEGKR